MTHLMLGAKNVILVLRRILSNLKDDEVNMRMSEETIYFPKRNAHIALKCVYETRYRDLHWDNTA